MQEKRNMPTLDNVLGSLVYRIPEQKLPDKETCSLIADIFLDLAEAHKYYASMAKGLADIAGLPHHQPPKHQLRRQADKS